MEEYVGIEFVHYRLLVDTFRNTLYLLDKDRVVVKSYQVATGRSVSPTPNGEFRIKTKYRWEPPWYDPHSNTIIYAMIVAIP